MHQHQPPSQSEAWALLVTNAKKQRSEVRLSELTDTERAEFEVAKQAEVSNWVGTDTISKILKNPDAKVPVDPHLETSRPNRHRCIQQISKNPQS